MNPRELAFGSILVVALCGLAGYFIWQQWRTFKRTTKDKSLSEEDRQYYRGQIRRRMFGSGLMLVLAGLLAGSYLLESEYQRVTAEAEANPDDDPKLKPEEKAFVRRFTMYWIIALVVLFVFAMLAAVDVRATLRYGAREHRRLRDEHRAALEDQAKRIREERNGSP